MSRPKYCPNCSKPFPQGEEEIADESILTGEAQLGDFTFIDFEGGYDCHCKQCGWTGDIEPDDEQEGEAS